MKPKTARVIITTICKRACKGCANLMHDGGEILTNLVEQLKDFDEVCITGGEPMLLPDRVVNFILRLRETGFTGKIFLYTAEYDHRSFWNVMDLCNGVQFTLHYSQNQEQLYRDLGALERLCEALSYGRGLHKSLRLSIDSRLMEQYTFKHVDVRNWSMIQSLQWRDAKDCPLPEHETLFTLAEEFE